MYACVCVRLVNTIANTISVAIGFQFAVGGLGTIWSFHFLSGWFIGNAGEIEL